MMQKIRVSSFDIKKCTMRGRAVRGNAVSRLLAANKEHCLPLRADIKSSHAADLSERPADIANASPFQIRKTKSDRTRKAVFAAVALAVLALLVSLVALALMKAPEF